MEKAAGGRGLWGRWEGRGRRTNLSFVIGPKLAGSPRTRSCVVLSARVFRAGILSGPLRSTRLEGNVGELALTGGDVAYSTIPKSDV